MSVPATKTANIGIAVPTTGCIDYESGNAVGLLSAAVQTLDGYVLGLEVLTAAGAIQATVGKVILKAGAADALTLAAPVAGQPSAITPGDDGQELTIVAADAFAYTVTAPANAINGNKHIATFGAAAGDAIKLVAYNGVWYAEFLNGVTLS
jgi:hypothetical protein